MKHSQTLARVARVTLFVGLAQTAISSHAALIAQESFDYTAGIDLIGRNGGTGFSTAWQAGGFNAGSNLNYDIGSNPLAGATGNHATTAATTTSIAGLTRSLSTTLAGNGSTYYMSVLLRPEGTLGAGLFSGFFGMTFGNNLTTFANEAFVGKPGGGSLSQYVIEDRGGSNQVASGVNAVIDDTVLLVLKMAFGSTNSVFTLYVDPLSGAGEPATANATKTNGALPSVSYLGLYSTGAFSVDQIRIGTTYADVVPPGTVPEPSILALLGLGLAGLATTRRRKQR